MPHYTINLIKLAKNGNRKVAAIKCVFLVLKRCGLCVMLDAEKQRGHLCTYLL